MEGSTLRKVGMSVANAIVGQDPGDGALPMLYSLTMPDVSGGEYYGPGGFLSMRGAPERQRSHERTYDRQTAQTLWSVSENLTGVSYLSATG
jgi:hypothetical protein